MESNIIPIAIERKLGFLKLTRSGKINLSVFSKKILYKGLDLLQRTHDQIPEEPYNTYYALCMKEAKRLEIEPVWTNITEYPTFSQNSNMTAHGELFSMKKCHQIMDTPSKVCSRPSPRGSGQASTYTDYGAKRTNSLKGGGDGKRSFNKHATFNQNVDYWKYGRWYKYPDQAIDHETNPTQPNPSKKPFASYRDPCRIQIEPIEELKKAIRSGQMDKNGLQFLRKVYIKHNPEIAEIIDAYLSEEHYDTEIF